MNHSFEITVANPSLLSEREYPLFWLEGYNKRVKHEVGACIVTGIDGDKISGTTKINTGGIKSLLNDQVVAQFSYKELLAGMYNYGLVFDSNYPDEEVVEGFLLVRKNF